MTTNDEGRRAVFLKDLFPLDLLRERIDAGYVRMQNHPDAPLAILNYAEKAQFEQAWDDVTEQCRGLIYNFQTGEVVARPFRKFHNWDASNAWIPNGPCLIAPKFDGSLGILYWNPESGAYNIATRGSFTSEQAIRGTQLLAEMEAHGVWDDKEWDPGKTALFEIIYPENRIVCDYAGLEALVLLDVIDIETGKTDLETFDAMDWTFKADRRLLPGFYDTIASDIPSGDEGFVVYWPGVDHRVKVKAAEYVHLHRIVTGLDERKVWKAFAPDQRLSVQQFCEPLPDEFHPWVEEVVTRLKMEHIQLLADVYAELGLIIAALDQEHGVALWSRRDFAARASRSDKAGRLFLAYDGNSEKLEAKVWESLKPEGGKMAKQMSEDVA